MSTDVLLASESEYRQERSQLSSHEDFYCHCYQRKLNSLFKVSESYLGNYQSSKHMPKVDI